MNGDNEVILDTVIVQSLWTGGEGIQWLSRVANGEVAATISAASVAELVRVAPDRSAEIQLTALLALPVRTLDVDVAIARRAGQIARDLDADDVPAAMLSAVVAATALETGLPIACVDDDFYAAMGCEIAE